MTKALERHPYNALATADHKHVDFLVLREVDGSQGTVPSKINDIEHRVIVILVPER